MDLGTFVLCLFLLFLIFGIGLRIARAFALQIAQENIIADEEWTAENEAARVKSERDADAAAAAAASIKVTEIK
eukprot:CAMPEP_0113311648 /NCGR_PEP_ID=MMETSP0010_2-20120614/8797_1 /TAXON_ID=216773 ORGANISM="Corethron hystrix, Strain 308" /NCGR_SAMPLE_ID=MMETSP0010_2 /ASSEMBLY_ACC=CAM_ASM_000155 /LENGTH=73 /DNA_ID=CAMNT_0000167321 /DNA_START=180 /DNA_END=401 /DNA_ORIENTATION=- /assembly_acc=CAM_ASM_000155